MIIKTLPELFHNIQIRSNDSVSLIDHLLTSERPENEKESGSFSSGSEISLVSPSSSLEIIHGTIKIQKSKLIAGNQEHTLIFPITKIFQLSIFNRQTLRFYDFTRNSFYHIIFKSDSVYKWYDLLNLLTANN